jgi:hypothetical protein
MTICAATEGSAPQIKILDRDFAICTATQGDSPQPRTVRPGSTIFRIWSLNLNPFKNP